MVETNLLGFLGVMVTILVVGVALAALIVRSQQSTN